MSGKWEKGTDDLFYFSQHHVILKLTSQRDSHHHFCIFKAVPEAADCYKEEKPMAMNYIFSFQSIKDMEVHIKY